MAGYSRVYNKQSGDVILAEEFVTEFGSIDAAFDETTGHSHSGATGEGAPISIIGNAALTTKVEIDSANNEVEFHVSGAEQIKITDGAILPITDNDIDLGAVGAEFKNLYIDGTANIDSLVADTADINGGTIDGATIATSDITVGAGKTLDVSAGTLTLANDQISGDKINGGTIGSITISSLTATSVDINGGTINGITDLAVADGGTGASTAAGARTNLGLGSLATASTINNDNWSGTDLSVVNGGTGASDAATARSNLGLVIGTNVQAYDADLSTIAGLAKTDGNFIVANGTNWVVESGATARASLGLGSIATQNSNSVNIDGGNIDGTAIGNTTPSSGTFAGVISTSLGLTENATINGYTALGEASEEIKTRLYTGTLGAVSTTTTITTGLTAAQIISVTTMAEDDLGNWVVNGSWNEAGLENWNIRTTVQSDGTIDLTLDSTSSDIDGNSYRVFVVYKSA